MPDNPPLLDRVRDVLNSNKLTLPVFNQVAIRLQTMLSSGTYYLAEVESIIQTDQALAAEVLRAANSAFFGGLNPSKTIRSAVVRLGMQQVTRLVVLASERAKYRAQDHELNRLLQQLWHHASATAMGSQWLARRLSAEDLEEECFLGGLLHDIGHLLILRALDEIKKAQRDRFNTAPEEIHAALISGHAQLGHDLLHRWNIPEVYCKVALDHHTEEFDSRDTVIAIVRLANKATGKMGISLFPDPSLELTESAEAVALRASENLLAQFESVLEVYQTQTA